MHGPCRAAWGQRWDCFLEELGIKKCYLKACQFILQKVPAALHWQQVSFLLVWSSVSKFKISSSSQPPLYPHSAFSFLNELQGWFPACLNRTSLTQPALGWNHQLGLPSIWKTNPSAGLSSRKRTRILKCRQASAKFLWTSAWAKLVFAVYLA